MKNQKGITLIALVVTIIVLLILAGVAIAMLTGDNSILNNAQKASSNNAYSSANDRVRLAYMSVRTQIMAKKVEVSTYDPVTKTNLEDLAKIVRDDIDSSKAWTEASGVYTSADGAWEVKCGSLATALPDGETYGISITYKDNNLLKDSYKSGEPNQDTYVYYVIGIHGKTPADGKTPQTARLYSNQTAKVNPTVLTTTPATQDPESGETGGSGN